jgi:hypothetical protein
LGSLAEFDVELVDNYPKNLVLVPVAVLFLVLLPLYILPLDNIFIKIDFVNI